MTPKRDKHIGTWVDEAFYKKVSEHSDKNGRSVSQTIVFALRRLIEREGKK